MTPPTRPRIIDGPIQQDWTEHAACLGSGPATWFPTKSQNVPEAKAICAGCPVREECLEYALKNREEFGVWGGLSPKERRAMPRGRRLPAVAACGTTGGYAAHRRLGEETCAACRAANAAYNRGRKVHLTEAQREDRNAKKREYRARAKAAA